MARREREKSGRTVALKHSSIVDSANHVSDVTQKPSKPTKCSKWLLTVAKSAFAFAHFFSIPKHTITQHNGVMNILVCLYATPTRFRLPSNHRLTRYPRTYFIFHVALHAAFGCVSSIFTVGIRRFFFASIAVSCADFVSMASIFHFIFFSSAFVVRLKLLRWNEFRSERKIKSADNCIFRSSQVELSAFCLASFFILSFSLIFPFILISSKRNMITILFFSSTFFRLCLCALTRFHISRVNSCHCFTIANKQTIDWHGNDIFFSRSKKNHFVLLFLWIHFLFVLCALT